MLEISRMTRWTLFFFLLDSTIPNVRQRVSLWGGKGPGGATAGSSLWTARHPDSFSASKEHAVGFQSAGAVARWARCRQTEPAARCPALMLRETGAHGAGQETHEEPGALHTRIRWDEYHSEIISEWIRMFFRKFRHFILNGTLEAPINLLPHLLMAAECKKWLAIWLKLYYALFHISN